MEQDTQRSRSLRTEGLVMRRYGYFGGIELVPPKPSLDEFEKYMFGLLKRMKKLHEEAYGVKPTKVLLGRFERQRFKKHIKYDGDKVYNETYIPDSFPMTELMSSMKEGEAVFVGTETRIKSKRVYTLEGLEVEYIDEPFHLEPIN